MKNQARRGHNPQSGSIFFWIFAMIFLFGALSFAMMQSSRTGSSTIESDQARLAASEMIEYATQVRNAVKTLRINGVPLRQLDFRTDTTFLQNGTPDLAQNDNCTDNSCRVFSPGAGGIQARQFYDFGFRPTWWDNSWSHVGNVDFTTVRIEGMGSDLPELALSFVSIKPEICQAINRMMGIETWPITEDFSSENQYYIEDSSADAALAATDAWHIGQDEPLFRNRNAMCVYGGSGDTGMAFYVLEAR